MAIWTEDLVDANFTALVKMLIAKGKSEQEEEEKEAEQPEEPNAEQEEEEPADKKTPQTVLCTEHEEQVLFYCIDCLVQLCAICVTSTHKTHDFCITTKSGEKVKQAIKTSLDEASGAFEKEVKAVDDKIGVVSKRKDYAQKFEQEVTITKNCHKSCLKKLTSKKTEIHARYPAFAELEETLSKAPKDMSPTIIDELQRSVKYRPEEPQEEMLEESCLDSIAKIYLVS